MRFSQKCWNLLCKWLPLPEREQAQGWLLIEKAYGQNGRHYHNLGHIDNMMHWLQQFCASEYMDGEGLKTLLLAIFFHDFIYDPAQKNNEEKSAEAATTFMQKARLQKAMRQQVCDLVMATKAHDPGTNGMLGQLLCDLDLQILGTDKEEYQAYSASIRKEYHIYPDALYQAGRVQVLRHFLAMPRIYQTAFFYERFEAAAKRNLQQELNLLLEKN